MERVESLRTENKFKKTEIGEIPVDWEVVKIGDTCEVIGGSTPLTNTKEFWDGDILWAIPTDITKLKGNTISSTEKTITERGLSNCAARLLPVGSILLTSRATIGECAVNSKQMATNQGFASLICKDRVYNWFMFYRIKYMRKEIERLGSGSTFNEISKKSIRELKIPLPPLSEQKKIAEILLSVDEAIEKIHEIVAKTKMLKKGLMQGLLIRGIGHKKFKKTEIGEIPVDWEVKTLLNVVRGRNDLIVAGPFGSNLKVKDYKDEGTPIIRLQNIEFCKFIDKDIKYISSKKAKELDYHAFKKGDIVLAKLGEPIGKTCIIPESMEEGIVVADVVRIRVDKRYSNKKFIMYVLNSSYCLNQMNKEIIGTTRPRVNLNQVRSLLVPYPPLPEQKKIAGILTSVDEEIEIEIAHKERLESIKRGLMQVLLTGKVRVKM